MKKLTIMIILLSSISVISQNLKKEKEIIKKVIQIAYVEGLQNEGDALKIESGFHPDFNMLGQGKAGDMWKYSITEWKAKVVQKRKEGEMPLKGDKKVSVKFKSIDISGNAAMVKQETFIGDKHTYTDYILLYKFDEGWQIVSKIFNIE